MTNILGHRHFLTVVVLAGLAIGICTEPNRSDDGRRNQRPNVKSIHLNNLNKCQHQPNLSPGAKCRIWFKARTNSKYG